MMNILFAATPQIALETLKTIHESEHNLVGVVCGEEKRSGRGLKINKSPIKVFAEEEEIKIFSYDDIKYEKSKLSLEKLDLDLLLVFAFGYILKEDLLNLPKYGSLNIHTSLLPKYRGAAPIQRSLINCEKETGITFMKMDAGLDTGPIICSEKISIEEGMNTEDLEEIMSNISSRNILQTIDSIEKNKFTLTDQNEDESSYATKITKEEAKINWAQSAEKIVGKINGLCPNPCAYSNYKEERIIFYRAKISSLPASDPGKILKADKNELLISGNDKCILVSELARQNKKRMDYKNFYNGSKDFFNPNDVFDFS